MLNQEAARARRSRIIQDAACAEGYFRPEWDPTDGEMQAWVFITGLLVDKADNPRLLNPEYLGQSIAPVATRILATTLDENPGLSWDTCSLEEMLDAFVKAGPRIARESLERRQHRGEP